MERTYALITGASSGIGQATAHQLACEGYNLILVARREGRLTAVKKAIHAKYPDIDIQLILQDLGQLNELEAFYDKTRAYKINIWFNNAGFGLTKDLLDISAEEMVQMMCVNDLAVAILSNLYANDYFDVEGAQLINTSSVVGYGLAEGAPFYSVSKFFVSAYTENLSHELRRKGAKLKVKIIAPAATVSEFAQVASGSDEPVDFDEIYNRYYTSQEMAKFISQLIHSDKVVGRINLDNFEFELLDPQFDYLGDK